MKDQLLPIVHSFRLDAQAVSCVPHGEGHINKTYLVITATGRRYILHRINHHIFPNVPALMENIRLVTEHLRAKTDDPRRTMTLILTHDGSGFYRHTDGSYWRMLDFVADAICLQQPETPDDFYESAVAFGTFQQLLADFPAQQLYEVIPNFHNTRDRYRIFREVLAKDPMDRARLVKQEIDFALAREAEASTLVDLLECCKLPLRVTHNDTKMNNVMLDAATRKALCVIDLDTVMPGSSLYDYGDSIRFGASSAAEDEQDLSKVHFCLDLFEVYTRGYLTACPDLAPLEKQLLPLGAKLMTLECGLRFLTDYLDGDHYFAIHRSGHNLDRCRTQFKLVADMESKWSNMEQIIDDLSNNTGGNV